MVDTYQAVYDAVRSRIGHADIENAVQQVFMGMNISFYAERCAASIQQTVAEYQRPSAVYRPSLIQDGNIWCALYGENLQDGVAGFGDTPAKAMWDFDLQWMKATPKPPEGE